TPVIVKDNILLKANTDYTVTYENNETHAVSKKAPVKMGSYTMHVKGKGSCEGEFSVPCTVTDKDGTTSITKVKVSIPAMVYRGDMPKPLLRLKDDILQEGTDYTVTYANTNAKGTATAVFIGQGAYTGVLKKTFKVKAASIASIPYEDITVSESAVYKKGGAKPDITVTMDGVKLTMGVDYTVSYKNNKKVGRKATVTITGKGNYSGKVRREFQVVAE
ncbi:MAG TPA: hypothetical protein DD414_07650, partial [Lachnospiraceae bacterium]|nr:hypothetical protein [Lachnospiraceae bacterium]